MKKSPYTISRAKFEGLSPERRHELLAELAEETPEKEGEYGDFAARYREMHSWIALDRYTPPAWLTPEEALEEYAAFHRELSSAIGGGSKKEPSRQISRQPEFDIEIAVDQIRSPYNLGSIIRLVDNFGFKGVVHASPWIDPDNAKLRRAARGCERWVPVRCEPELLEYLKESKVPVIGIEERDRSLPLREWDPSCPAIILLGNETYGIPSALLEICDDIVHIPMYGYKNSMNVHHALAIAAQRICEAETARRNG